MQVKETVAKIASGKIADKGANAGTEEANEISGQVAHTAVVCTRSGTTYTRHTFHKWYKVLSTL